MSWMQKLYDTYESCRSLVGVVEDESKPPLMPIYHMTQQAQIEAVIDTEGGFRSARVLENKNERTTLIPCTEKSAVRTSDPSLPHPLFDNLSYLAGDYTDYRALEGKKADRHAAYLAQLSGWCTSSHAHPRVRAVLRYLQKGCLMKDLIQAGVLYKDDKGALPEKWTGEKAEMPSIFKAVAGDQAGAFVRFQVVQADGSEDLHGRIWKDPSVWQSYIDYRNSLPAEKDFCYVLGKEIPVSTLSPKYIRRPGDGAKLISANDSTGFTYRGRFETPAEAFRIGRETTEKAHNALKWLIPRQAYVNGDQVILTWRPDGGQPLNPCDSSLDLLYDLEPDEAAITTGEDFARRFRHALAGYGGKLTGGEDACIIGLDSATPGRLSVFYYREMKEKDLLDRVESWHETCQWYFWDFPKKRPYEKGAKPTPFIGTPSPEMIVKAAYGESVNEKLKKSAVQRLLPCIADKAALPPDFVRCAVRRASNPVALGDSERARTLAVACALVRKYHNDEENRGIKKPQDYKERWKMVLDTRETDRNYLYGRLLAMAEIIELSTYSPEEKNGKRQTNAERMMNPFSQRPFTTWPLLYEKILPYEEKMPINLRGYYKKSIADICGIFSKEDYENDRPLNGLFLLGYFCQQGAQFAKKDVPQDDASAV